MISMFVCHLRNGFFFIWKIDWLIVLGFTPYRQYSSHVTAVTIGYEILKFPWRSSRAYSSTKSRETVFCVPRGCYPWHGAPFNVPSDWHIFEKWCLITAMMCPYKMKNVRLRVMKICLDTPLHLWDYIFRRKNNSFLILTF